MGPAVQRHQLRQLVQVPRGLLRAMARSSLVLSIVTALCTVTLVLAEDKVPNGNGFVHESSGAATPSSCKEVAYVYRAKGLRDQVPSSSISGECRIMCKAIAFLRYFPIHSTVEFILMGGYVCCLCLDNGQVENGCFVPRGGCVPYF